MNKPELLPPGNVRLVIDLENMMPSTAVGRIEGKLRSLEADTGLRMRVLTQAYPNTPGLAIKDYWKLFAEPA